MDELQKHISKLREDFTFGELSEKDINPNPFLQFEKWMMEAIGFNVPEVQAMTLSTVTSDGKPSSRIVYLREFKNHEFTFYGNYDSRKGKELSYNPSCCLNFFWPQLERQIRIEGKITLAPAEMSDNYFKDRPRDSQIGAWASNQSSEIKNRNELEAAITKINEQFKDKPVPRPESWGGWILNASYYEFWQGRKSRLHDRLVYRFDKNSWKISRLSP